MRCDSVKELQGAAFRRLTGVRRKLAGESGTARPDGDNISAACDDDARRVRIDRNGVVGPRIFIGLSAMICILLN